jgi:DnaK suppressor protein
MKIELNHFKDLLEKEVKELETQLGTLGRKNPDSIDDWETVKKNGDTEEADELDVAENIEQFENNNAVLENLETRLHEVKHALERMSEGKYGVCEVCENEIEEDRLVANPAATTCIAHMK